MRETFGATIILAIALNATSCTQSGKEAPDRPSRTGRMSGKTLAETIADNRTPLLSLPGVLKVEAGDCETDSCIKVFVDKKTEILASQIPLMLETWRVEIVESGM